MVICYKKRKKANVIDSMKIIGEIKNKNVILVDDMMDTGGTICKASEMMMANGAKSVRAICTHAILSGKAYENIADSSLNELVVTNSLSLQKKNKKIKVLDISDLFAQTIKNVCTNESISSQFIV